VEHIDNEESKVEGQPVENVFEDSPAEMKDESPQEATASAPNPVVSHVEHEGSDSTPTITQTVSNEEPATVPETSNISEEKPDHDFEVIDPVSSTSSFVSEGMTVSMEQEQSPFDDFESAFSGSMSEAKVVPGSSNNDFEAPFDTSFEEDFNPTFEQPQPASLSAHTEAMDSPTDAAAFADSFTFDNNAFDSAFGSVPSANQSDMESAFSVDTPKPVSPPDTAQNTQYLPGFSAFAPALEASSIDSPGSRSPSIPKAPSAQETIPPPSTEAPSKPVVQNTNSSPPTATSALTSSSVRSPQVSEPQGLQELLNMGFSREQGIDALRRYDNDLEKATNFLLDF
jgi:hypothetical protein